MFLNLRSVIYQVDDLEKARNWYGRMLNSEPVINQPSYVVFNIGHDRLGLNPDTRGVNKMVPEPWLTGQYRIFMRNTNA